MTNRSSEAAAYAERNYRFNAVVLIGEACAFFFGLACFDPSTVVPVLLKRLGASDTVIGSLRFILVLGFTLPALFAAHHIHGRRYHKRFLVTACGIGRAFLLTLPLAILWLGPSHPTAVVVWLMTVYCIYWLADGACAVSWLDIVAKAIPGRVRGRFFGVMQTISGLLGIGAGVIVSLTLGPTGPGFPLSFALLAILWCLGNAISQAGLFLIREPEGEVEAGAAKPRFVEYVRRAAPLMRQNPTLKRLVVSRLLLDGGGIAASFYVLHAEKSLGAGLAMVGVFQVANNVGRLVAGPVLGIVSDRWGRSVGIRTVGLAMLIAPVIALLSGYLPLWCFVLVFVAQGVIQDGMWMVFSSAVLETVRPEERPFAVGVSSLFQLPAAFYGVLGGLLSQYLGYPAAFAVALSFALAGLAVASSGPVTRSAAEAST